MASTPFTTLCKFAGNDGSLKVWFQPCFQPHFPAIPVRVPLSRDGRCLIALWGHCAVFISLFPRMLYLKNEGISVKSNTNGPTSEKPSKRPSEIPLLPPSVLPSCCTQSIESVLAKALGDCGLCCLHARLAKEILKQKVHNKYLIQDIRLSWLAIDEGEEILFKIM